MPPRLRSEICAELKIARSSFYSQVTRQIVKDEQALSQLLTVHKRHPNYGLKRLGLALGWSINKTRRLVVRASLSLPNSFTKRGNNPKKKSNKPARDLPNHLKPYLTFRDPKRPSKGFTYRRLLDRPGRVWVQDFLEFKSGVVKIYLAVILDVKTRIPVGWSLQTSRSQYLVLEALKVALKNYQPPDILHSDRGTEYTSGAMFNLAAAFKITLSFSDPGSPYQNSFMEGWFSNFRRETDLSSRDLGKICEVIAAYMHYYTFERLHTALEMTPYEYSQIIMHKSVQEKGT